MEGSGYIDIYATKGIEYLLVIGFLLTIIIFWKYLIATGPEMRIKAATESITRRLPDLMEWFRVPEGLYFHKGHAWAKEVDKGMVTIGLDDFAQRLVGKIDAVDIPAIGSTIKQGGKGWSLKLDSQSFDMLSPLEGEILEINEAVIASPENIHRDPYGKGWLIKVRPADIKANLVNLLSGNLARRWMEEVIGNIRIGINPDNSLVYQDGGLPIQGMAKSMSPDKWDQIIKEFFLTLD
jgi:glycine cleavage system H lipoate-binding protein